MTLLDLLELLGLSIGQRCIVHAAKKSDTDDDAYEVEPSCFYACEDRYNPYPCPSDLVDLPVYLIEYEPLAMGYVIVYVDITDTLLDWASYCD